MEQGGRRREGPIPEVVPLKENREECLVQLKRKAAVS